MAKPRSELSKLLRSILLQYDPSFTKGHLYFREPSSKMQYPCIIYDLDNMSIAFADNSKYLKHKKYTLTLIDENPDSELFDTIHELPMCAFDRSYQSDGLNHFAFTLYY